MTALAIRFAAELFGVAGAAVVGASMPLGQPVPLILGVAAAAALVVFWGLVAAPKAHNRLGQGTREFVGSAALLVVAGLLAAAGQPGVATAYALVVVIDHTLIVAHRRPSVRERPVAAGSH